MKELAKRKYYQNQFTYHKNNLLKQWSIINEIICNKCKYQKMITSIINPVKSVISDKSAICNLLNDYFVNMDAKISLTN